VPAYEVRRLRKFDAAPHAHSHTPPTMDPTYVNGHRKEILATIAHAEQVLAATRDNPRDSTAIEFAQRTARSLRDLLGVMDTMAMDPQYAAYAYSPSTPKPLMQIIPLGKFGYTPGAPDARRQMALQKALRETDPEPLLYTLAHQSEMSENPSFKDDYIYLLSHLTRNQTSTSGRC